MHFMPAIGTRIAYYSLTDLIPYIIIDYNDDIAIIKEDYSDKVTYIIVRFKKWTNLKFWGYCWYYEFNDRIILLD